MSAAASRTIRTQLSRPVWRSSSSCRSATPSYSTSRRAVNDGAARVLTGGSFLSSPFLSSAAAAVRSTHSNGTSAFHSFLSSPPPTPTQATVKVGLCQLLCGDDKQKNIETAERAIQQAVKQGAQLVVLPEMFNCPYSNASFGPFSEILPTNLPCTASDLSPADSPTSIALSTFAHKYNIHLIAGSIPERSTSPANPSQPPHLYNTSLVLDPSGHFIAKHRKLHLFDIDVPGRMTFRESDTLTAGASFTAFDAPWGRTGLGVCYDIRFAEYAEVLRQAGCSMLVYPGAFNTTTGPLHWELLARARAVDTQCFVLVCSPARNPASTYQAWGHSSVVSPWGRVVATVEEGEAVVVCECEMKEVGEFRQMIPTGQQKRTDLYQLTAKQQ